MVLKATFNNISVWMFYGGDNSVNNQKIYNVEGNNRLLPGLQPLTTGSVLKMRFLFFSTVP